jgi:hypothetical protein
MPIEGLVILIVTLLAFLAIGAWFIVRVVKGPEVPKGNRFEHKFAGNKAIVVFDPAIVSVNDETSGKVVGVFVDGEKFSCQEIAEKCAVAIAATEAGFKEKNIKKADVNTCVFWFQTDETFEQGGKNPPVWWKKWSKNVSAYATKTKGNLGPGGYSFKVY